MEKRDLYDINRKLTGETIYKGQPVLCNRYILVVLSCIQKDGKYGLTGGHPKSGESSIQGMITEIKEEIGLDVEEKELELIYSDREDTEQVFFDVYYFKKDFDIEDLVLQKEEVDFVEWDSIGRIKQLIDEGLFKKSHEEVYRLIHIFKQRGINLE